MTSEYQIGIQPAVKHTIIQSKKMGLPYITKQQIINEIKKIIPDLKNPTAKVGQALYQLQQEKKYRRVEIRKIAHNKYSTTPLYAVDMWSNR